MTKYGEEVYSHYKRERPLLKPRDHTMKETINRSRFIPEGWSSVTPRILPHHAEHLLEFLTKVFGGTGKYEQDIPSGVMIGDSQLMIGDAGIRRPLPAFLYVYVSDTDAPYQRALDAGARSLKEPAEMPYGDRRCM